MILLGDHLLEDHHQDHLLQKKTGHLIKGLIIKLPPMDHQLSKFY